MYFDGFDSVRCSFVSHYHFPVEVLKSFEFYLLIPIVIIEKLIGPYVTRIIVVFLYKK